VHQEQQVIVHLQVQAPGVRRVLDVIHGLRLGRIAHVDDAEAARADMADIGVAALHHDLLTVAAAVLIGMADQAHVAGMARRWNVGRGHLETSPICRIWRPARCRQLRAGRLSLRIGRYRGRR
jgi:hypothetical protein